MSQLVLSDWVWGISLECDNVLEGESPRKTESFCNLKLLNPIGACLEGSPLSDHQLSLIACHRAPLQPHLLEQKSQGAEECSNHRKMMKRATIT